LRKSNTHTRVMQAGAIPELRTPTVAVQSPVSPDSQVASDYCRNRDIEQIRTVGMGEVGAGAHHDAGDWARAAPEPPDAGGAGRCRGGGGGGGGGGRDTERHVESGKGKDSRRRRWLGFNPVR